MDLDSYFAKYSAFERPLLLKEAYTRFRDYDNALFALSSRRVISDETYRDSSTLLPAIIAAEDGRYYEKEDDMWEYVFEPAQAAAVKQKAERLADGNGTAAAMDAQRDLLSKLPGSSCEDALVFAVCYILCFSAVSDANRKLLHSLFD